MRKLVLQAWLVLFIVPVSAQPFHTDKKINATSGDEIDIQSLKWIPGSHDFWVDEQGGIYLCNADDPAAKKIGLK